MDDAADKSPTEEDTVVNMEEASPPRLSPEKETQIQQFLVLTIHRIFKISGALNITSDLTAATHVNRMVKCLRSKWDLSEEFTPEVNMYRSVAEGVNKELKKRFMRKRAHMLLLPHLHVEGIISDCIQKQIKIEMKRTCCTCTRRCMFITTCLFTILLIAGAVVALCLFLLMH